MFLTDYYNKPAILSRTKNHLLDINLLTNKWICKYCNKITNVGDVNKMLSWFDEQDCISDNEKLIKDIIE